MKKKKNSTSTSTVVAVTDDINSVIKRGLPSPIKDDVSLALSKNDIINIISSKIRMSYTKKIENITNEIIEIDNKIEEISRLHKDTLLSKAKKFCDKANLKVKIDDNYYSTSFKIGLTYNGVCQLFTCLNNDNDLDVTITNYACLRVKHEDKEIFNLNKNKQNLNITVNNIQKKLLLIANKDFIKASIDEIILNNNPTADNIKNKINELTNYIINSVENKSIE